MTKRRKIILATATDDLRAVLNRLEQQFAEYDFEIAPPHGVGNLNGEAVNLAAMLLEIDVGRPAALDELSALARSLPGHRIIAAAPRASTDDVRRLFRAGAADVLTAPFTFDTVSNALNEVLQKDEVAKRTSGLVVTALKAGGGVGATTTVLNLAQVLARGAPRDKIPAAGPTAVLDFDLQLGDSHLAMNIEPRSTLLDVLRAHGRFDARFLQASLIEHRNGLRLLAPPPSVLPLEAFSSEFALDVVQQSASLHALTFVDLPGAWAEWTLPILDRSNLLLLIVVPTVASVLRARRILDALAEAQVQTPIFLLLNRMGGLVDAIEKPARISSSLDLSVDASLAFDAAAARAADRGDLVIELFPNARLSRDLRGAAAALQRKLATLQTAHQPSLTGVAA